MTITPLHIEIVKTIVGAVIICFLFSGLPAGLIFAGAWGAYRGFRWAQVKDKEVHHV